MDMASIPRDVGTVLTAFIMAFGSQKLGDGDLANLTTSGSLAVAGLGILYITMTAGG